MEAQAIPSEPIALPRGQILLVYKNERFSGCQCLCNLFSCRVQGSLHCAPRDVHPFTCLFLDQPFAVTKSQCLKFIPIDFNGRKIMEGYPCWFKYVFAKTTLTTSLLFRSWRHKSANVCYDIFYCSSSSHSTICKPSQAPHLRTVANDRIGGL